METLLLVGLVCVIVLFLVALALVLRLLERLFPSLTRFLDRHFSLDERREW